VSVSGELRNGRAPWTSTSRIRDEPAHRVACVLAAAQWFLYSTIIGGSRAEIGEALMIEVVVENASQAALSPQQAALGLIVQRRAQDGIVEHTLVQRPTRPTVVSSECERQVLVLDLRAPSACASYE
jgi:hypothetical protein